MAQESLSAADLRSRTFTQFSGAQTETGDNFFNRENAPILSTQPQLKTLARDYLKSGKVGAVIPVRNEMRFGALPGVLHYAADLVGKDNVLVIDADSTDTSVQEADRIGLRVVTQQEVEDCLDGERIHHDFGITWPLPQGKGRTMTSFAIFNAVAQPKYLPDLRRWAASDGDITNPWHFDHFTWLAYIATQDPNEQYIQIRAAQPNRNNQTALTSIAGLQGGSEAGRFYYHRLKGIKWLLTGQHMIQPIGINDSVNVTGYGTEIADDLSLADLAARENKQIAQIEIPVRCIDGGNDAPKEEAMMFGLTQTIDALNEIVFQGANKHILSMSPRIYRRLNAELRRREMGIGGNHITAPIISYEPGPNIEAPVRLDQFLPPARYLKDRGYVNIAKVNRLANRLYGKSFRGA